VIELQTLRSKKREKQAHDDHQKRREKIIRAKEGVLTGVAEGLMTNDPAEVWLVIPRPRLLRVRFLGILVRTSAGPVFRAPAKRNCGRGFSSTWNERAD
jgi:hypothetical protein